MAKLRAAGADRGRSADPSRFIRANTRIVPVSAIPEIRLHAAHEGSGLGRLVRRRKGGSDAPPYWAFAWAGGLALARHILDRPATVSGRRVLDLGAGSGVVAIAAAKAGARTVHAADIDPYAVAALRLNAAANGVAVSVIEGDLTLGPPPAVDVVLAGDVFYEPGIAKRMTAFLERCASSGIEVLVGDPGRANLPRARLRLIAEYRVPDVGEGKASVRPSGVFAFG